MLAGQSGSLGQGGAGKVSHHPTSLCVHPESRLSPWPGPPCFSLQVYPHAAWAAAMPRNSPGSMHTFPFPGRVPQALMFSSIHRGP